LITTAKSADETGSYPDHGNDLKYEKHEKSHKPPFAAAVYFIVVQRPESLANNAVSQTVSFGTETGVHLDLRIAVLA